MTELVTTVADKIDRAVQRVTPFAYRVRRRGRRLMRRALRRPRSVSEGPNLLPLLIQVLASFTKADGVLLEEEIDSSLGFLRYDYPEAVYSELRELFRQALYEQQDLAAMAQKLGAQLSTERKIMLGVQLYDLISQAGLRSTLFINSTRRRIPIRRFINAAHRRWNRFRSDRMAKPM
jgi:hypothetical protein